MASSPTIERVSAWRRRLSWRLLVALACFHLLGAALFMQFAHRDTIGGLHSSFRKPGGSRWHTAGLTTWTVQHASKPTFLHDAHADHASQGIPTAGVHAVPKPDRSHATAATPPHDRQSATGSEHGPPSPSRSSMATRASAVPIAASLTRQPPIPELTKRIATPPAAAPAAAASLAARPGTPRKPPLTNSPRNPPPKFTAAIPSCTDGPCQHSQLGLATLGTSNTQRPQHLATNLTGKGNSSPLTRPPHPTTTTLFEKLTDAHTLTNSGPGQSGASASLLVWTGHRGHSTASRIAQRQAAKGAHTVIPDPKVVKGQTEWPLWWFAPFFDRTSFGKEAATLLLGAVRSGAINESSLWLGTTQGDCKYGADGSMPLADFQQLDAGVKRANSSYAAIVVCHSLPPFWARPRHHWPSCAPCPPMGYTPALAIGRAMAETDIYHAQFVEQCNRMDEVWVPSKFSLDVLANSGVTRTKLHIVPIAVNTTLYDPDVVKPLRLPVGSLVFGSHRRFAFGESLEEPPPSGGAALLLASSRLVSKALSFQPDLSALAPGGAVNMSSAATGAHPEQTRQLQRFPSGDTTQAPPSKQMSVEQAAAALQAIRDALNSKGTLSLEDQRKREIKNRQGPELEASLKERERRGQSLMVQLLSGIASRGDRQASEPGLGADGGTRARALRQAAAGGHQTGQQQAESVTSGSEPLGEPQLDGRHHRSADSKPFVFVSTFKWEMRKGWDVLLRAYLSEFSSADNVELYILTKPFGDSGSDFKATMHRWAAEHLNIGQQQRQDAATLYVIATHVTVKQYAGLYRSANCYVSPTRGEGWGMPITEAMSMGLPAIATNWSGVADFVDESVGYPLRYTLSAVPPRQPWWFRGARWADADVVHLRQLMRHVYENRDEAAAKGIKARRLMQSKYSPEMVGRVLAAQVARIQASIKNGSCTECFNREFVAPSTMSRPELYTGMEPFMAAEKHAGAGLLGTRHRVTVKSDRRNTTQAGKQASAGTRRRQRLCNGQECDTQSLLRGIVLRP